MPRVVSESGMTDFPVASAAIGQGGRLGTVRGDHEGYSSESSRSAVDGSVSHRGESARQERMNPLLRIRKSARKPSWGMWGSE